MTKLGLKISITSINIKFHIDYKLEKHDKTETKDIDQINKYSFTLATKFNTIRKTKRFRKIKE